MTIQSGLFTSESVSDGHPDKICDQISDTILDACLLQDPAARVAVETAIKGNLICLLGEITTSARIDAEAICRQVLRDIGHADRRWGLDPDGIQVVQAITQQSPEIAQSVGGRDTETGAGDQGLMFGYASAETESMMPLPITLAHALMLRHHALRAAGQSVLGPDAKAQVTVRYDQGRPKAVTAVVLSSQHVPDLPLADLREMLRAEIIMPVLGPLLTDEAVLHLNPAGSFTIGGPVADAGLTGRKIIVDSYGGMARHGGGAFSGKDGTKVDRSGAYAARQLARDVVMRGWAQACEVRIAYAIGHAHPVAVAFDTFGTSAGIEPARRYAQGGVNIADMLRPRAIIDRLGLTSPIFRRTASFGHFGRDGLPWEAPLLPAEANENPARSSAALRDFDPRLSRDRMQANPSSQTGISFGPTTSALRQFCPPTSGPIAAELDELRTIVNKEEQ